MGWVRSFFRYLRAASLAGKGHKFLARSQYNQARTTLMNALTLLGRDAPTGPSFGMPRVISALRDAVKGISDCDEHGRSTGPYDFPSSEVLVGKAYASSRGDAIVTLHVHRPKRKILRACAELEGEGWRPHTFAVLADGTIRHLGSSLRLVDAGDYDGDGHSELLFQFNRYDNDGYTLFFNDFRDSVSYGWIYH